MDWVIKKHPIDEGQSSSGCPLNHPSLLEVASSYHRLGKGRVFAELVRDGKVDRLYTTEEMYDVGNQAPEMTCAKFRGNIVKQANERKILSGVNWSYIQLFEPCQKLFLMTDVLQSEFDSEDTRPEDFQGVLEEYRA